MSIDTSEIGVQISSEVGADEQLKKNLKGVLVLPLTTGALYPGMIAPALMVDPESIEKFENYLNVSSHVGLNFINPTYVPIKDDVIASTVAQAIENESEDFYNLSKKSLGPVLPKIIEDDELAVKNVFKIGVLCKVVKKIKLPDGTMNVLLHALARYKIKGFKEKMGMTLAIPEILEESSKNDLEQDAYTRSVINQVKKLSELNPYFNEEMKLAMFNTPSASALSDLVAFSLSLENFEAQDFLETLIVKKRFAKLLLYLQKEKDLADIQKKISEEVNDKVNKFQREFFLKEQLKAIRQELGLDQDDKTRDYKKIKEDILKAKMPEEVMKIALEELEKLETIPETSPEYNLLKTYLNVVASLPWSTFDKESVNIPKAKEILEKDHYGLELAKSRVLEFLAVRKLRPDYGGTILCFAGPPGVGKTSMGRSIASALKRKFFRISLGGMRDEAEIKGHRRTYVGAMPGKIIQAMKRVGVNNPVIMLDEIDKMGSSFQGDPASALLEVLDPEQNSKFLDNYLDLPFDLSKVLFLATANYLNDIPEPLLDRMEVIELSGYTVEEKMTMANKWIFPKQLKNHGLVSKDIHLTQEVLKKIIADYAREPGVRGLEQVLAKICRKAALLKVEKGKNKTFDPKIKDLENYLGSPKFRTEAPDKVHAPGVVVGLAWTSYGGDILFIESIPLEGKGFKITGQIGEVMNESANLAYSYVKSLLQQELLEEERLRKKAEKNLKKEQTYRREDLTHRLKNRGKKSLEKSSKDLEKNKSSDGGKESSSSDGNDFLANHEVHLHLPAGATPKDGPSAGISMALALYSLAHEKRVRSSLAMTGELSLTGKVLPIGGLKEKVLAAKRAGIKEIIFPFANEKDLKEVPVRHQKGLVFYPVKYFSEVLDIAFKNREEKER
jgi:ATP-dependent Lon protease